MKVIVISNQLEEKHYEMIREAAAYAKADVFRNEPLSKDSRLWTGIEVIDLLTTFLP